MIAFVHIGPVDSDLVDPGVLVCQKGAKEGEDILSNSQTLSIDPDHVGRAFTTPSVGQGCVG